MQQTNSQTNAARDAEQSPLNFQCSCGHESRGVRVDACPICGKSRTSNASAATTAQSIRETLRIAYCNACKATEDIINPLVGKVVGKVMVSIPQKYEDRSYECAAWSENRISGTGVFDIVIRQDPHNKDRLYFAAELPATVESDYFPALFCGVGSGKPYDTTKNAGKPCRNIQIVRADTAKAIQISSASDAESDGTKWAILPQFWQEIADYHRALVHKYLAYFPLAAFDYSQGDDQHLSRLGQVGHCGGKLDSHTDSVEEITRALSYRGGSLDYFAQNNPFIEMEVA